jgi:hypothetical protein
MTQATVSDIKRLELAESIHRNTDLVIVAGAGVSLYTAGYPKEPNSDVASWIGLLKHGLDYCRRQNLLGDDSSDVVELQLEKATTRNLIDAAQQIHDWLDRKEGNPRYFWLKESIGQLKVKDPKLIEALAKLGGLLATLNYDELCEEVTGRPGFHWKQQAKIDDHINRRSNAFIFHMHGSWQEPDSVVLDQQSYHEIARDETMQGLMHKFARWGMLLFVGCSGTLADPNFQTLLRWGNTALKQANHRHFVLCRKSEEARLVTECQRWAMLEPLVYGERYADMVPFLDRVARESGAAEPTVNAPIAGATRDEPGVKRPADVFNAELT